VLIVEDGNGGHSYLSEDSSFCHRVRQCGFPIVADTRIRLGHIGRYVFSWKDAGQELSRVASSDLELRPSQPAAQPEPPSVDFSAVAGTSEGDASTWPILGSERRTGPSSQTRDP
jgi:hypothetical protein